MPALVKPRKRKQVPPQPELKAGDFWDYLIGKAEEIAPRDVESLVSKSKQIRSKMLRGREEHERLYRELEIALALITDHVEQRCPQIPYSTVSLLAAAIFYFLNPVDVIPDVLPVVGSSDDALVLQLAFDLGRAGIERYCTWSGTPADGLFRQ